MRNILVLAADGELDELAAGWVLRGHRVFLIHNNRIGPKAIVDYRAPQARYFLSVAIDLSHSQRLGRWIAHQQLMHGPIDRAVVWGPTAPTSVLQSIVDEVEAYRHNPWDIYHFVALGPPRSVPQSLFCRYHAVVLPASDHQKSLQQVFEAVADDQV